MKSRITAWLCVLTLAAGLSVAPPVLAETDTAYTLPDIIALSLTRHPSVASAEGVVDQRVGQRVAAGAYPNPSFSGAGGHGILRDGGRQDLLAAAQQRLELSEYNVSIGQPLEWPAKRAALAGSSFGLVETRLNLTTDVKVAFFDLLLALRDLELSKQNVTIVEDVRRIVGVRVRLGEAPQFDLIKADVEVLKANQAVTRAENTVRVNRVILDTLTGGALGSTYQVRGDFLIYPGGLNTEQLVARAATEHPAVLRLQKFVEQADRSIEFQRQNRVPNLTVNGSYFREIGREAYVAGFTVPTPLWYQQQGEIAASLGAKRTEEAELLRTRNELFRQVNQFYQEAQTAQKLIEVLEKGLLKQAEEALRIAKFSFQQGAASLLEVLDAQRVQRQILFDYAEARYQLSVALSRLERAVGGTL